YDVYQPVKFIASDEYKNNSLHEAEKDRTVANLIDLYMAKTSKSHDRVYEIYSSAGRDRPYYIEEAEVKGSHVFRTTKEGRQLIWGWGWGLFLALAKENWLGVTALITIIGTVPFNVIPLLWQGLITVI